MKDNNNKPDCKLSEVDGNVFMLMGAVSNTLRRNMLDDKEVCDRVWKSASYSEALSIMGEYVNII